MCAHEDAAETAENTAAAAAADGAPPDTDTADNGAEVASAEDGDGGAGDEPPRKGTYPSDVAWDSVQTGTYRMGGAEGKYDVHIVDQQPRVVMEQGADTPGAEREPESGHGAAGTAAHDELPWECGRCHFTNHYNPLECERCAGLPADHRQRRAKQDIKDLTSHIHTRPRAHSGTMCDEPKTAPRSVEAHRPPRFDMTSPEGQASMLAYLAEHGYAVVASVADEQEVAAGKALMWDFLEAADGQLARAQKVEGLGSLQPNRSLQPNLRRGDARTWGGSRERERNWLPDPGNGILGGWGFGQSAFMWHFRNLPKVKAAFAAIWETEDLLVSFDGGNAFRPWRHNPAWLTKGGWYHVDQNATLPNKKGKVCVQGLVTLHRADEETGGLVVLPGSHLHHTEICRRSPFSKSFGDFIPMDAKEPVLASTTPRLVCAEPGDLILWDSRTVHCNTPALTAGAAPPTPPELPAVVGAGAGGKEGRTGHTGSMCDGPGDGADGPPTAAPAPASDADHTAKGASVAPAADGGGCNSGGHGSSDGGRHAELIRQCAYVCMTPSRMATPAQI